MRFLLSVLIASSLFMSPAFAQQDFSSLEIVIGGAALAESFSGVPDDISTESVWGAQAGASLRIGSPFYIEPGIGVAGAAYTLKTTWVEDGFEEDLEDVLGHIGWQIPVRVGYRLMHQAPVKLRIFAGVAPLFITQVEEDSDFEVTKDDYNSTVWNASFGAGVDVAFLTFSVFYEAGLTNLFTEEAVGEINSDIKLSGIGGSLGLRIAL